MFYLSAYESLEHYRTKSEVGYNPISFETVERFAERYNLFDTLEEFDRFRILIAACDNAFLTAVDAARAKQIRKK